VPALDWLAAYYLQLLVKPAPCGEQPYIISYQSGYASNFQSGNENNEPYNDYDKEEELVDKGEESLW